MKYVNLLKIVLENNWQPAITEEYLLENLTEDEVVKIKHCCDVVKKLEDIYKINAIKFGWKA